MSTNDLFVEASLGKIHARLKEPALIEGIIINLG
jgi:hypothetical protein